ncbi:MAG: methylmalonyl-CoA carboxyltransferase, partial [Micromonosporaceae bacterium]|nr:methylmalonyl-CoA carboxyltransferase [Micromonosporaceae bacterium]
MPATKPQAMEGLVESLQASRERLEAGGGPARVAKQHDQGKLTARERLDALVDPSSFEESGLFSKHRAEHFGMQGKEVPADGVVTGAATVDGRLVHVASQDFTVMGGTAGEVHCRKVAEA